MPKLSDKTGALADGEGGVSVYRKGHPPLWLDAGEVRKLLDYLKSVESSDSEKEGKRD